jgi:hypothetical protein
MHWVLFPSLCQIYLSALNKIRFNPHKPFKEVKFILFFSKIPIEEKQDRFLNIYKVFRSM